MDNVQCCENCIFCNNNMCTQSPLSEKGPVSIPDEFIKTYKCREYVAQYPFQSIGRKQLKE